MPENRISLVAKTSVYSWGARVNFVLGRGYEIATLQSDGSTEVAPVSLCWKHPHAVSLRGRVIHPELVDAGQRGFSIEILADPTAGEAEQSGIQLCLGLLWMAASEGFALSLDWPDSPLPCRVVDRLAPSGMTMQGFGSVTRRLEFPAFVRRLEEGFAADPLVPRDRILLSMELHAGSKLEASGRARFVMLVSAIESLVDTKEQSPQVVGLVQQLIDVVDARPDLETPQKNSLRARLGQLRRESVLQGLRRTLATLGIGNDDIEFVAHCYDLRSQIVHRGARVPELQSRASRLEEIMKRAYANALGTELK